MWPIYSIVALLIIGAGSAGAVGCAVLAVFLLGRLSKFPPWRRY